MIAKYNGNYYYYVENKRTGNIITRQKEKATDGFEYEDGVYFKKVAFEDLEEAFALRFIVSYDSCLKNLPQDWEVAIDKTNIKDSKVLLRYANGILPGWTVEEKNVCIKYVDVKDITAAREIRIFKRRSSDHPYDDIAEEKVIDPGDLIEIILSYCKENL